MIQIEKLRGRFNQIKKKKTRNKRSRVKETFCYGNKLLAKLNRRE